MAATRRRVAKAPSSAQGRPAPSKSPVRARKLEFRRKLLHASIAVFAIGGLQREVSLVKVVHGLTGALVIIVCADLLRFNFPSFARLYERLLGFLMRPSERFGWNGVIFYLLGCIYSLTLLPPDIGVLAIVMLSWVDVSASTFGRAFGRYTPVLPRSLGFGAKKSLAGFLGALAVAYLTASYFWTRCPTPSWALSPNRGLHPRSFEEPFSPIPRLPLPHSTLSLDALVAVSAVTAALAESIDFFGLDDNVSLPVLTGSTIYVIMYILG